MDTLDKIGRDSRARRAAALTAQDIAGKWFATANRIALLPSYMHKQQEVLTSQAYAREFYADARRLLGIE